MKTTMLLCMVIILQAACTSHTPKSAPPEVVPHVDLAQYTGVWYEIASFPQHFQKGCADTQGKYSLKDNGEIEVLNSCFRNGKRDTAKGTAWVADKSSNAKLKVSFFWPFQGDYWIIELGTNYEYAVVSAPTREYLWILSREPRMDKAQYTKLVEQLREKGFDTVRLQPTIRSNPKEFK